MIDHIRFFEKGLAYRIRNRKTKKCLCLCSKLQLKTTVEEESCDQLWIITQIKNEQYQIAQIKAGTVLTLQQSKGIFSVKMQKDKILQKQLWVLVFAQTLNETNYFWIKPSINIDLSLCASSLNQFVKVSPIDLTLNICLWQFVPIQQNCSVLSNLSVFKSDSSNLILTLPDYSSKEGTPIIQYPFNGGGNQRWIIEPYKDLKQGVTKEYTIRNYCSGLHLTAVFTKLVFKVTQTLYSSNPDQRWILIHAAENVYLLQSVLNNSYYLGITNDKGGSQISLIQDRLKSRWIVQGLTPVI